MLDKRYKRNEAFRYEFGIPLKCTFHVYVSENGRIERQEAKYNGDLIDISPNGLKVYTEIDLLKVEMQHIEFHIELGGNSLQVMGKLAWKKVYSRGYTYGFTIINDDIGHLIIDALKQYTKSIVNK